MQYIRDKNTIRMAFWNGPVLILITTLPAFVLCLFTGAWWLTAGIFLASVCYYSAYEYMHWCMHFPGERFVERRKFFAALNRHHLLHHREKDKNLNVVFPFADLIFRTLITR